MAKILGALSASLSLGYFLHAKSTPQSENGSWQWDWDGRNSKHGKGVRNLYLVRHGQYYTRSNNQILTKLGRTQAETTSYRLLDLRIPFDRLVHSSLIRAKQTASILNSVLNIGKVEEDCLLNEDFPCVPEPCKSRHLRSGFPSEQLDDGFKKHIHRADPDQNKDSHELYVFHANAIRYFVCRALQLPPNAWLRFSVTEKLANWRNNKRLFLRIDHVSFVKLKIYPDGRVVFSNLGQSAHMNPEQVTSSNVR